MLRAFAVLLLGVVPAFGATLQGLVLDHETGRPLARSLVVLDALPGTLDGGHAAVHTDVHGVFSFTSIPNGAYLLSASRIGFATLHYGENATGKPGKAVLLSTDLAGVEIRLHRLGAIAGTVWDENQIGLAEVPVLVYSASRPITLVAHGVTDERGMYRVGGLPAGSYLVRNGAHRLEDGSGVTPSFFQATASAVQARPVEVRIDQTSTDINFQPGFGKTFHFFGRLAIPLRPFSGTVDLISDTGRQSAPVDDLGNFSFEGLTAGQYELASEMRNAMYRAHYGAHQPVSVDRDVQGYGLPMLPVSAIKLATVDTDGKDVATAGVAVFARRRDLDTEGSAVKIVADKTELAPGNWEFSVVPPKGAYAAALTLANRAADAGARADSWTPIYLEPGAKPSLRVVLSMHPAAVAGRVTAALNEAAAGTPVYLETMDLDPNARQEMRVVYSDQNGHYEFSSLPPGRYRLGSSPDIDIAERGALEAANAKVLFLKEGDRVTQDLP